METLAELRERRAFECRLTPDRALRSLDDAESFLRDRTLLTRTADSALPSLFEACHEDPYAPGKGGFGEWPATKWWWFGALGEREGVHILKVHRGKSLMVTDETAALLDPICRAELARMERQDPEWARLLRHLGAAGPSAPDDLRVELGLKTKELKSLRYPLERCGAVVSRSLAIEGNSGGHSHTSELARWDQLFPGAVGGDLDSAIERLIVAGARAAVVAPATDVRRWFSWSWLVSSQLVDRLLADGRLLRPEEGWIAAGSNAPVGVAGECGTAVSA